MARFHAPKPLSCSILALALLLAPLTGLGTASAQQPPRPTCVAGETPADRINAIIGVLIGHFTLSSILASGFTADAADSALFDQCPGVAVLSEFDKGYLSPLLGLSEIDVWEHALKGESLAQIAQTQGVSREILVAGLQTAYSAALDRTLAAGQITDTQRQRIADRILPQFGWLVDWSQHDAVRVATGDVNGDNLIAAAQDTLPGTTDQQRSENAIRLIFGFPVVGSANGGVWKTLAASLVPDGSLTPEDAYAEYLAGKSLLDIHTEHGGDPTTLADTLTTALTQALDADVAARNLTPDDRAQLEPILTSTLANSLKHHVGDPLPNDFLAGGPDDQSAAALAVAGPTCQGIPATVVAVGAGPIVSGPFGDVIVGTTGNDTIDAGGGVDLICALAGNDTIEGGQGRDTIYADEGADLVFGEGSGIVVTGGGDTIHGGAGNDHLLGQVGDDEIHGDNDDDELEGGDGADDLLGGNGNDALDGGSGNDSCTGGNGVDTFSQC
jgi:Ca2+-binding RTX toxin-like protein